MLKAHNEADATSLFSENLDADLAIVDLGINPDEDTTTINLYAGLKYLPLLKESHPDMDVIVYSFSNYSNIKSYLKSLNYHFVFKSGEEPPVGTVIQKIINILETRDIKK